MSLLHAECCPKKFRIVKYSLIRKVEHSDVFVQIFGIHCPIPK
jgi:hypothetical protein